MRALALAVLPAALAVLAGCNGSDDPSDPQATDIPKAVAGPGRDLSKIESEYGTPVQDRVATIGLLNKRNDETQDLQIKPGESRRVGNVIVKVATCERSLPWERPAETGAFVQVFVEERASVRENLAWRKVFSGWLFKNSPSLNAVEHPVYDVWVKDCAMKFPGEEAEVSAPATSAAKASGSGGTPAAAPAPSPSPSPSPPSSPTPTEPAER